MKYSIRLSNPQRSFFDHKSGVFLDYYRPQGETNILSEELKKAVQFKTLIDLNGEVLAAIKAEAEPKLEEEAAEVKAVEPSIELEEVEEEVTTESIEEPTEEETESDNEEKEAKAEPKKKPASKGTKKSSASTKK